MIMENKDQKNAADFCSQLSKPLTIAELTKERLRRAGKKIKEEISKERGVKVQSISDALTRLVNKDILVKNRRLFYSLNPKYFFKGDRKGRDEILKLSVEYHKSGRNVE